MLDPDRFINSLFRRGVTFTAGVPDSLLKSVNAVLTAGGGDLIAANEGNAVALAIGHHLATGGIPLVYMQNSGLGNTVNPITSLADPAVYGIPMLLLIGWRGEPGVKDEPQHVAMGAMTEAILNAVGVPHWILPDSEPEVDLVMDDAFARMAERSGPIALLIRKDVFGKTDKHGDVPERPDLMSREEAIGLVLDALDDDDIVVSTTGMASRELFEHRARSGAGHARDFLTVGGMGHASSIALGIAISKPDRRIVCIDGDGAFLMHMGAAAMVARRAPASFLHIVLNNAAHDSVGGQPTLADTLDLAAIASICGYANAVSLEDADSLIRTLSQRTAGPRFIEIKIRTGSRSDLGRPTRTPARNKADFMVFVRRDPDPATSDPETP